MREILEDALGLTNLQMVEEERGFLVDCKSAVGEAVLTGQIAGSCLGMEIVAANRRMSAEEIFD